tara:strand:- start:57 stop:245 length:189 start_codon:yes stop_codon:yes gene_type:complete
MALTVDQKLAALLSEQQQIAKNYQEAESVVKNCEIKLIELRGAIAVLEEIKKANQDEEQEET